MSKATKALIIVESPAKMKTLKKFLGSEFTFASSIGHIRDLPKKGLGIDIANDFTPTYEALPDKKEVIDNLRRAAKQVDIVYLSPDPDREGEAIAWHILQILPPHTPYKRVLFNSFTKSAVEAALKAPREIDEALVNAQQARRLLDRIVGYKISPILNRRVQSGQGTSVSAGRVQSPALKLVVDREKEIEAFVPVEYWNIDALLSPVEGMPTFKAYLYSIDGLRIEKELQEGKALTTVSNGLRAKELVAKLEKAQYRVDTVERKEKRRNPVPPFITSTLQQEASRHFGFGSSRTMSIAQKLYEGIDLGQEGTEGLITYMRTDSTRVAPEMIHEVRGWIQKEFGENYLPKETRVYAQKNAQDAHEAIRPTHLHHTPDSVRPYLSREEAQLYGLIWKRFVASQMNPAVYDTLSADIATNQNLVLRATGSVLKFAGFLAVYEEKKDEDSTDEMTKQLPPLSENQPLKLHQISHEQAFTKPPARYSEASLVKELERLGIGRPSTYSAIMQKIQSRDYTTKVQQRLVPTSLGRVIAQFLEEHFNRIMDVRFTAQMEEKLELVAENKQEWKHLLHDFWKDFAPTVELAEKGAFVPKVETDRPCPTCGANLQKIWYRSKYFYGCSRYPECTYRAGIEEADFDPSLYAEDFDWNQPCPKCQGAMTRRHGKFGPFLGCARYPECKGIVNIPKKGEQAQSNAPLSPCPAIGCEGHITARRSRFGKTFYSCSNYPDCDVIVNQLEDLTTKYADHPKTAYVKKPSRFAKAGAKAGTKTTAKTATKASATTKTTATAKKATTPKSTTAKTSAVRKPKASTATPAPLSAPLRALLGVDALPFTEVTKQVWAYIKSHQLQDPKNGRTIIPDKLLSAVIGPEPIDMFAMTKRLSGQMEKKES